MENLIISILGGVLSYIILSNNEKNKDIKETVKLEIKSK